MILFITTAVKTSNPTFPVKFCNVYDSAVSERDQFLGRKNGFSVMIICLSTHINFRKMSSVQKADISICKSTELA
jgi:hypothetical protein